MTEPIRSGDRGFQILRALNEDGPLSLRALHELLDPPISERRLRDATKRLADRGLICRRFDSLPRNAGHYFQLSRAQEERAKIGEILGVPERRVLRYHFRGQELAHSELCAIWARRLRRLLPSAGVSRDFHFRFDSLLSACLLRSGLELDLLPDILLHIPSRHSKEPVTIAVEIERSQKSAKRIRAKLIKFATRTTLDGVIYLCARDSLANAIQATYQEQIKQRANRIRHYGDHFLMFGNLDQNSDSKDVLLLNAIKEPQALKDWIKHLVAVPLRSRRDAELAHQPNPADP